jgi:hypothetical protein
MRPIRNMVCWLGVFGLLSISASSAKGQIDEGIAARVKATFLCRVPEFTTWPENAAAPATETLTIGVLGDDPHGISQVIQTSITNDNLKVNGLTVSLESLSYVPREAAGRKEFEKRLLDCQVLFIASSDRDHWPEIRGMVARRPVLVFGEISGFSQSGGMIEFVVSTRPGGGYGIDLHVDLAAVHAAGLRLKSTFLSIRNVVVVKQSSRQGAIHLLMETLALARPRTAGA